MSQGEFLSLSKLTYADVLNGSKSWDRQSPLLATSELSRQENLTDNDIAIRQINGSLVLSRVLDNHLAACKEDMTEAEENALT